MTTATAAKVHGRAKISVEETIHYYLADDAVLEWLPQEKKQSFVTIGVTQFYSINGVNSLFISSAVLIQLNPQK